MPAHHDVRASDVFIRRLHGTLAAAAERDPVDFPELLLTPGIGARTCNRLPWWRRWCTARLIASAIPHVFRWPMAARTAIPIPCR